MDVIYRAVVDRWVPNPGSMFSSSGQKDCVSGGYFARTSTLVRPDPLEVAAGFMVGIAPSWTEPFAEEAAHHVSARQALEQVILKAVARPPCVVDFSGGRDSSVILAVATYVARQQGLAMPIPFTRRYPLEPMAEESAWQEMVIRHLRLPEWERSQLTTELDLVGQRAQQVLRRYGLLLPAPMYHWTLSFEMARGGSHVTGEGGDEFFGLYRARAALAHLHHPRRLLHRRPVVSFLSDIAPQSMRTWSLRRSYLSASPPPSRPWMTPEAFQCLCDRYAEQEGAEPFSWRRALLWQLRHRYLEAIKQNGRAIAADYDVVHSDPFLDPSFVFALSRSAGVLGFADRAQAMTFLASDLLPASLLRRPTKAGFNRAYFTDIARTYAKTWDGRGVDLQLVDPEALKREWLKPVPSALSTALLQAAWMSQHNVPIAGCDPSLTSTRAQGRGSLGS